MPLDLRIDKFGNQRPSDADKFQITQVSSDGDVLETTDTQEQFAPSQFIDLDNSERLAKKSFEKLKSGVRVKASEKLDSSYAVGRDVFYERIIIDPSGIRRILGKILEIFASFVALLNGSAVTASPFAYAQKAVSPLAPKKVSIVQEGFVVVNISDLTPFDESSIHSSQTGALNYLSETVSANPELADAIQVVPAYEVNAQ